MLKGTYLERFLESIAGLPTDVSRNFAEIRARDLQVEELSRGAASSLAELSAKQTLSSEDDLAILSLKDRLVKCKNLSDEKVALASQAYDWIEKSIKLLDNELRKFEAELATRQKMDEKVHRKKKITATTTTAVSYSPYKKKAAPKETKADSEERKYCFCNKVSFGEMVECESSDCAIGWFHFDCVGLESVPKGKWYCPTCREKREIRKQKKKQETKV